MCRAPVQGLRQSCSMALLFDHAETDRTMFWGSIYNVMHSSPQKLSVGLSNQVCTDMIMIGAAVAS